MLWWGEGNEQTPPSILHGHLSPLLGSLGSSPSPAVLVLGQAGSKPSGVYTQPTNMENPLCLSACLMAGGLGSCLMLPGCAMGSVWGHRCPGRGVGSGWGGWVGGSWRCSCGFSCVLAPLCALEAAVGE